MRRLAALLACLAWASVAEARELWRRGDASLELSGSVRTITNVSRGTDLETFTEVAAGSPACVLAALFPDCPAFAEVGREDTWLNLTRLRTRLDLRAAPELSFHLVYDNEWRFGTLDTLARGLGESLARDDFLPLDDWINSFGFHEDSDHRSWRHLLYRAYLRWESKHAELVLGRQRIAWGVGRLFSPIDRFNFVPPLAIEADQSPGVDAVDARWRLSGFTYLEAVYARGDDPDDSAWALRWHGVARDSDYSLVLGVFEEALVAGADLATNLGPAAFGTEVVYTDPERDTWPVGRPRPSELDPYWQVVVSLDRSFDLGSGLYALVEYLYNGNALGFGRGRAGPLLPLFESTAKPPPGVPAGLGPFVRPASQDIFGSSRVVTSARHTTGFGLGYDLTPILRVDLVTLLDWDGPSAIFYPTLRYSPVSSLELTLGYQDALGGRRSSFGETERLVFLDAEWFF